MAINAAGIIFSSLNDNTLSRLTSDRTVAAIPFACRYRLVDFCLSNMVNANISNITVVANYNYRSLMEHIGSGKDWDLARRSGGIHIISPYQTAHSSSAKMFSTHMEALISMKEYIDVHDRAQFAIAQLVDEALGDVGVHFDKHLSGEVFGEDSEQNQQLGVAFRFFENLGKVDCVHGGKQGL